MRIFIFAAVAVLGESLVPAEAVPADFADHPVNVWVKQSPRAEAPSPKFGWEGSGAYDPYIGKWIHWGGHDGIPQGFHLFLWDPQTAAWEQRFPDTSPPGVCCVDGAETFDLANRRFVRFPGASLNHGWQWSRKVRLKNSGVWLYDPVTNTWSNMRPPPYREPEKYSKEVLGSLNACGTYDERHQVALSFGGQGTGGGMNNLFVYDAYANRLERLETENPPSARDGSGFCYDSVNDCAVVFGSQYLADEKTYIRAVNDTKDNDTIAAIVGAAVGALHGKQKLPKRWIDKLSGRTTDSDDGRIFELLAAARRKWCPRGSTKPEPANSRYQAALDAAVAAAREAGRLIRDDFHRPGGPRGSGGHAEVDEEAEQVIREKILAAFPAAYRGEETGTAGGGDGEHIWLVDPNDGTSAYLKGWRGSAVSIALVRKGVLVLGVVYAPCYPDDGGDLFAWAEGCGPVVRNGKSVTTSLADKDLSGSDDLPAIVYISQDADKNPAGNAACVAPARFIAMPSIAYRLALVAAGEGVAAISLNGPGDWDYAGGHALLVGVGGTLIDQTGKPITYGSRGESHCQWCFGGAPAAAEALHQRDWHSVFSSGAKSAGPFALVRPERGLAVADAGQLVRAQGCLLGQLAGDSLGGLVEFSSAAKIKSKHPNGLRELMDGGQWGILAGQPTDDSELALMLARSIVHAKGYDPAAALDAYLHWYDSPPFDIGGTTSSALRGAKHGKTPQERLAGAKQHANTSSQANGSLMRISPLAIFGAGNPVAAADWARADSSLTHPHQVCQDACAVFVAAIATAIATDCTAEVCYQAALAEARRSAVAQSVVDALREAASRPPEDFQTHQGWVLIALQNAFYQLLHAPSLEDGVVQTVMAGGDTDTNAAIAGALAGAVHGRDAIPPQWLHSILSCRPLPKSGTSHPRPVEFWPVDALRLAEKLLVLGSQASNAAQEEAR